MSKRSQFFILPLSELRPPGTPAVLITLLFSLYSPFFWILLEKGPWDPKRIFWLKSLPALPGLCIQTLGILDSFPPLASYCAMGVATILILFLGWKIGRQTRLSLLVAFLLVLGFSSWNSWLAYQSFHNL